MQGDRSRYGLLVSALGAVLLAVAVFLPWYGLSFTPAGVAAAQRAGEQVVQQYGNAALQAQFSADQGRLASIAGREFLSLSAHQALHDLNVVLLVLAALALLDALVPLARAGTPLPEGAGRAVVLLGAVAAACVAYRMAHTPFSTDGVLAVQLREGAWGALLGALMVAVGGIWPRSAMLLSAVVEEPASIDPFDALSGWTPGSPS